MPPKSDPASSNVPYQIYNIGNHSPAKLLDVIAILEKELGKTASKNMLPMQPGDVPATFATFADVEDLASDIDVAPRTPIGCDMGTFINIAGPAHVFPDAADMAKWNALSQPSKWAKSSRPEQEGFESGEATPESLAQRLARVRGL